MIEYKLKIDLQGDRNLHTDIVFSTGDSRGYALDFSFYSYGEKVDLSDYALTIKAKRADGKVIIDKGETDNARGYYVVADNMYAVPGEVELEVALVSAEGSLVTSCVLIATVREGFGEADLDSKNVAPIVAKILSEVKQAEILVEEAKELAAGMRAELEESLAEKVDKEEGKGLSTNDYTDTEKLKVAEAGTQINNLWFSLDATQQSITNKVDKEEGKGLSANDYTDEEKATVASCVLTGTAEGESVCIEDARAGTLAGALSSSNPAQNLYSVRVYIGGVNLYNDHDKEVNKNFNSSGAIVDVSSLSGGMTTSANVSGYIPVVPGSKMTISHCNYWVFYDANKNIVEKNSKSETIKRTFTVPVGAVYMRFSYHAALTPSGNTFDDGANVMAVLGSTLPNVYRPFTSALSQLTAENMFENTFTVKTTSPYISITTDTPGVVVCVEYVKDIGKLVENLTNAIISLGGNV